MRNKEKQECDCHLHFIESEVVRMLEDILLYILILSFYLNIGLTIIAFALIITLTIITRK